MFDFTTRHTRISSAFFHVSALLGGLVLSACNTASVTDGLAPAGTQTIQQPPADIGAQTALAPQQPVAAAPDAALADPNTTQPAPGQNAALGGPVSPVSFLPVTGAPQSAVSNLAASLRQAAKREAIPVMASLEQGARFQVKGYFSALNDGTGTILVYVWDVLDQNGARVHRISGQERGQASPGDPWSGIAPSMLAHIADVTMSSLRTWMSTKPAG